MNVRQKSADAVRPKKAKVNNFMTIHHDSTSFAQTPIESTPESQRRLSVAALSNLCDKMQDSSSLLTRDIVRRFELEPLLHPNQLKLLHKRDLMTKLEELANLFNAMSALFYIQQQYTRTVPLVFKQLREECLKRQHEKIQDILERPQDGLQQVLSEVQLENQDSYTETENYFNECEEYI
jgi:hypothetical protein